MDKVLWAKMLLGIFCAGSAPWLISQVEKRKFSRSGFLSLACALLMITRLALFLGILVLGDLPASSDVTVYYQDAKKVLEGYRPFWDYATAYGLIFPYLAAIPLLIWDSAKSIILLSIIFEILSLPLWFQVAHTLIGEEKARWATILYIFGPITFINVPLTGQNHIWISFFLACSFWFLLTRKTTPSGLTLGFSVLAVKFFSLLFFPLLALVQPGKLRTWLVAFLFFPALAYGTLVIGGCDIWDQVKFHGSYNSSGNVLFILSATGLDFDASTLRWTCNAFGLVVLALCLGLAYRTGRLSQPVQCLLGCGFILLLVLFINKKAFTSYLEHAFFPLCCAASLLAQSWRGQLVFGLFGTLAVVEPSLWYRWMNNHDFRILSNPAAQGILPWHAWAFLGVETLLLGSYAYFLKQGWHLLGRTEVSK